MKPTLSQRIRAALLLKGSNVREWAAENGWLETEVWHQVSGRREYPDILIAVADLLDESVDGLRAEITNRNYGVRP